MKLHFKKLGEGDPLFIVHGLFGSGDNWYTLGKKYAEQFTVYLIDLRNHGKSNHADEHNYDVMADDLLELVYDEQLTFAHMIGHSMGGKAVMRFAEKYPNFVDKLVIADMGPKEYKPHHQLILESLNAVKEAGVNSRKEAEDIIHQRISTLDVVLFLMKNLYWREAGVLDWKMNVEALENNMEAILAKVPESTVHTETLFLRGEKSDYIVEDDFDMIHELFPNSSIEMIENAGHWLHAENPKDFYDKSLFFLEN